MTSIGDDFTDTLNYRFNVRLKSDNVKGTITRSRFVSTCQRKLSISWHIVSHSQRKPITRANYKKSSAEQFCPLHPLTSLNTGQFGTTAFSLDFDTFAMIVSANIHNVSAALSASEEICHNSSPNFRFPACQSASSTHFPSGRRGFPPCLNAKLLC